MWFVVVNGFVFLWDFFDYIDISVWVIVVGDVCVFLNVVEWLGVLMMRLVRWFVIGSGVGVIWCMGCVILSKDMCVG